ncbi:MAG TPA: DUF4446 family protein [Symbiobacteriaceae bacterium]
MDTLMTPEAILVSLAAAAVAVVALTVSIVVALRQAKLLKRYRLILSGATGHDLESLLLAHATEIEVLQSRLGALTHQLNAMEEAARLHVQKTAIVRFNAFPDTGSDLSFAIAMLDAFNNGFVLSSLYGRSESRVYAKPVRAGKSTYALSEEEKQAIGQATATAK